MPPRRRLSGACSRAQAIFVCDGGALMSIPGGRRPAERPRDKLSLLRNHSLFRDLPAAVIEHLGSYMKTRKGARGTRLFAKGDPRTRLIGGRPGAVKRSVQSPDGQQSQLTL